MSAKVVNVVLSRQEAQALARGKHTRGCYWNSPEGGQGVRCTCGFVPAREEVRKMLRMTA